MMVLNKIGDAYATDRKNRDKIKAALEAGGMTVALQSESGLIIMEMINEVPEEDEDN